MRFCRALTLWAEDGTGIIRGKTLISHVCSGVDMKTLNVLSVFATLAISSLIGFAGATAQADALSMKITNKVLNEHSANMRAGITPHQRPQNKAIDNRVEGAKTVASATSMSAPVMAQHPSDEVEPARGPKTGRFIPKKK